MKSVVVYESHWGNTEAIARAIAGGIGPEAVAMTTDEATAEAIDGADLIVAGAPVMAFRLPTNQVLELVARDTEHNPGADLSHPSMRDWLEHVPAGTGRCAAFETRLRYSPGGATGAIEHGLERAGYRRLANGRKFMVAHGQGPLRVGELDAARAWGATLAKAMHAALTPVG